MHQNGAKGESRKRGRMWGGKTNAGGAANPNGNFESTAGGGDLPTKQLAPGGGQQKGKRMKLASSRDRLAQLETNLAALQGRKLDPVRGRAAAKAMTQARAKRVQEMRAEIETLRNEVMWLENEAQQDAYSSDAENVMLRSPGGRGSKSRRRDVDENGVPYVGSIEDMETYKHHVFSGIPDMSIFEDFVILEKLGEGTYGVVTKARHRPSGKIVALKKVKLEMEEEGIPATTIREVSLLKRVRHPNVVTLYECIFNVGNLQLVFEFLPKDLHKYLSTVEGALSQEIIRKWMNNLFSGIDFCLKQGILHRDLKPQNLLVTEEGSLKIADFGLGREIGVPLFTLTHEVVTLWYRCPEILLGTKKYGVGVDTWSIGCIMAELLSQTKQANGEWGAFIPLFAGDCEIDQLFKIFQLMGTPTVELWENCQEMKQHNPAFPRWLPAANDVWARRASRASLLSLDLIKRCLHLDPANRLVPKAALAHPYFTSKPVTQTISTPLMQAAPSTYHPMTPPHR